MHPKLLWFFMAIQFGVFACDIGVFVMCEMEKSETIEMVDTTETQSNVQ